MKLREVFPITWDGDSITIGASILTEMALYAIVRDEGLILWNNRGLWGLIPCDLSANALQLFQNWQLAEGRQEPPTITIQWDQTIPIQLRTLTALQKS